ncbi:hypothetical protein Lnau_2825 [Legionella nautarum]|uniref:Uncharacterized protein n=1 Tax=Legionella nautarum TaxID=45070 RepID=A0A0W0WLH4_9GAMM|nr:hypothetical protein [Legionella nautarum]KTD33177.1 hypothetical protein Lnau_2825 [Legionella nautarum]
MESNGCAQEQCSCPCHLSQEECHHHGEHDHGNYFLELADEAWQEVLIEKIKEYILEKQNDQMVKLAKIIAEGNHQRWKNRMEKKQHNRDFMEEIRKFFSQSK